jgi:DNA-binding protein Fis
MKRLVVLITPMIEAGTPTEPPANADAGVTRMEAVLSDNDAERILAMVTSCNASAPDQRFAAHLVEQELALAGPHAHDLWQRIVSGVERKLISRVYDDCDRVKTRAAARLGIDRNTLHKKLRQYELIDDVAERDAADADNV